MLADGLAVIGGGVALFPWQQPPGFPVPQRTGDVGAAFAESLAAGQAALFPHHRGVLRRQAEDRRALRSVDPRALPPSLTPAPLGLEGHFLRRDPPFPWSGPHLGAADAPLPAAAARAVTGGPRAVADGIKGQETPHTVSDETHLERAQLGLQTCSLLTPHPIAGQSSAVHGRIRNLPWGHLREPQ